MLLERESLLTSLDGTLVEMLGRRGRLIFLGGEAGAGKSSLVSQFAADAEPRARVLRGFCDGGSTPRPLGPLADVAASLGSVQQELGQESPRRSHLFPEAREALAAEPTLFVIEDAHWADEATVDFIRFLGRRLTDLRLLVVVTFRDDEVRAGHPLGLVMGDLATASNVARMQVPLLSVEGVARLVHDTGSVLDVSEVHQRTGGNPFFVTEILSADTGRLPPSVRDAVLARAARLSPRGRAVLSAASVIGLHAEIPLLLSISGETVAALDECIELGVLLDAGDHVSFRHELAREVIDEDMPSAGRLRVHRAVLDYLLAQGASDHRRLAYHAQRCGDAAVVAQHAPRAAEEAARLGSHREAATHYRAAVRHGLFPSESARAQLLEALSYECYLTDQLPAAIDSRREALTHYQVAGDALRVGDSLRWLSRLSWFVGRNEDADRYGNDAVAVLQQLPPSSQLAMAYSNLSQLRMLADDTEAALVWGEKAMELATTFGDNQVISHALNNMGTARLTRGEDVEGQALLQRSLDLALINDLEEHAARAYTNLASISRQWLLPTAERRLRDGIAYCIDHDLDSWRLYMEAELARVLADRGRLEDAARLARSVLRHPNLSPVTKIDALTAAASVAIRRGHPDAEMLLMQAQALAQPTGEAQRLTPVAAAAAELAWTAGKTLTIGAVTDDAWRTAMARDNTWDMAELAWWRHIAGLETLAPEDLPQPFALMMDDRPRAAAAEWAARECLVWEALAFGQSTEPADAKRALRILERLGATATAQALTRDLRRRHVPVPRGPRAATQANPAGLTSRELEVLELMAEGLSNGEIAQELTMSKKTVGHHVSAILRKVDAPSRSRAIAAAAKLGIGRTERQPT